MSVVDFNGDMHAFPQHDAEMNAVANNWLEEAAQATRDAMPKWGQVDTSQAPYYGLHAPSRLNKQPRDGDKNSSLQYDNKSIDLLGLDGEAPTDDSGDDPSQPALQPARGDLLYATPTAWSTSQTTPPDGVAEAVGKSDKEMSCRLYLKITLLALLVWGRMTRKQPKGPIRMARKQGMWDDWLSWRDNWRSVQRGGNGGGRSRPVPESEQDQE